MKPKMYFLVPGTVNVLRPLKFATCRHTSALIPRWIDSGDCTECYLARHKGVVA